MYVDRDHLKQVFNTMETEELVDRLRADGLTAVAKEIAVEELKSRGMDVAAILAPPTILREEQSSTLERKEVTETGSSAAPPAHEISGASKPLRWMRWLGVFGLSAFVLYGFVAGQGINAKLSNDDLKFLYALIGVWALISTVGVRVFVSLFNSKSVVGFIVKFLALAALAYVWIFAAAITAWVSAPYRG